MKDSVTGEKRPIQDWQIKICDFGLARSLIGVTSAKIITDFFSNDASIHKKECDKDIILR
jgi:hypothetical protein